MYYYQRMFSLFCGVRRLVSVGGWLVTGGGRLWGVVWPARFGAEGIGEDFGGGLFLVIRRNLVLS